METNIFLYFIIIKYQILYFRWHSLKSNKPEKKKSPKNLGEIEVKVNFSDRPILMSNLSKKPNKESQEQNTGKISINISKNLFLFYFLFTSL